MALNLAGIRLIFRNNFELICHILFWALYSYMAIFGLGTMWTRFSTSNKVMVLVSFPLIFNLNLLFFLPAYLKSRSWLKHFGFVLLSCYLLEFFRVLFVLLDPTLNSTFFSEFEPLVLFTGLLSPSLFFGLLLSYIYRFSRDWLKNIALIDQLSEEKAPEPEFIFVNLGSQKQRIQLAELMYLESDGNYVHYHTKTNDFLVRSTMKEALEQLPKKQFVRIHRSFAVNLAFVEKVEDSSLTVGDKTLSISQSYKANFKQCLNPSTGSG